MGAKEYKRPIKTVFKADMLVHIFRQLKMV